jgi:DNA primase large subunit
MRWFAVVVLVVFLVCVGLSFDAFDDVCLRRPNVEGC